MITKNVLKKIPYLLLLSITYIQNGLSDVTPPHLDLEMTSGEYRNYLSKQKKYTFLVDEKPVAEALALGDRLSKWIAYENEHREPGQRIRLTSASGRRGIPIESPSVYSDKSIEKDLEKVKLTVSGEILSVLAGSEPFPSALPVPDEEFVKSGRLIDRIYQTAARFKALKPYIFYYKSAVRNDVRGYYYFYKNNILSQDLSPTSKIAPDKLDEILKSLSLLCLNSGTSSNSCKDIVQKAKEQDGLNMLHEQWMKDGKKNWDSYFYIPNTARRVDVTWKEDNQMIVPFNTPSELRFKSYLQDNIEDEFRWKEWKLLLNFGNFTYGPELVFKSGVVPHVNRLGGNQIVMDQNQSIEEYESKWTIRHEFGHVIGLPDCYHEFYDEDLAAFVNYQLDISDLMCSRAGNINERIYKELQRQYSRSTADVIRSWGK